MCYQYSILQRQMIHVPLGVNVKIKQAPETWFKNNCGGFFDPRPFTLDPRPFTLDPRLVTLDPRPFTLDPRLVTLDPRPSTLDQKANSNFSREGKMQPG